MKLFYAQQSLKSGIYKILNTHTNRIYIGQAKRFKQRWSQHKYHLLKGSHGNTFFQHDFNKCKEELGHDDFLEFHVLEVMEGSTKEARNKREEQTYDELKSCFEVYNVQKTFKGLCDYKFKDPESQRIKQQKSHAKFQKPIQQFDLNGNFIAKFTGIRMASRSTLIHQVHIGNCAKGKQKTAGGFIFLFEQNSATELPKHLMKRHLSDQHKRNISKGSKRLSGENHPQFGMHPSFATLEKQRTKRQKPIVQVDLETNLEIKKWNSITEASSSTGIDSSAISKACRGKKIRAGGFGWKFI
jgi:hypothetical protein